MLNISILAFFGHKTKPSSIKSLNISSINLHSVSVKCNGNSRGNQIVSSKSPTLRHAKLEQILYPLQYQITVKTYNYKIENCYSTIRMKLLLKQTPL